MRNTLRSKSFNLIRTASSTAMGYSPHFSYNMCVTVNSTETTRDGCGRVTVERVQTSVNVHMSKLAYVCVLRFFLWLFCSVQLIVPALVRLQEVTTVAI